MRPLRIALITFFVLSAAMALAQTPCEPTVDAAIEAYHQGIVVGDLFAGYRVTGARSDPLFGVDWVSVGRCDHPGWPGVMIKTRIIGIRAAVGPGSLNLAGIQRVTVKLIRYGDLVRLWRNETNVHLEMAAVSEESGDVGDRVRLRVVSRQQGGDVVRYVFGLVRGPADVEME